MNTILYMLTKYHCKLKLIISLFSLKKYISSQNISEKYYFLKLTYPELSLPLFPIAMYSDNCFKSNFKICSLRSLFSYSYICIKALDARSLM